MVHRGRGGWKHYINQSTWVGFESLPVPWTLDVEGYAIVAENNVGTLRMNNGGESLLLIDSQGNEVDSVTIDNSDSGVSKVRPGHNLTDDQFSNSLSPTPGYANHGTSQDLAMRAPYCSLGLCQLVSMDSPQIGLRYRT